MSIRLYKAALAVVMISSAGLVQAIENIEFNGFMTAGATKSDSSVDSENGNITDDVGFDQDTRIGIQVSADINARMSVTAQLLGSNREEYNFDTFFDWGYVNYSLTEDADIRGGKIKFPTFLVSDYIEVGYAYPWIRPPSEVYYSNPITAITGVDVLYRVGLGPMDILFQPYFGTANDQKALVPQEVLPALGKPPGSVEYEDFDAKNMAGINVALSNEFGTLRAGYLQTEVSASSFGVDSDDVTFWSVGATADWHNIILYSEYFDRDIDGEANLFFPNQNGWYATLGYRIGRFLPHVTYAELRGDNADGSNPAEGMGLEQNSITAGLRYELGTGADLKVEYQRAEPESGSRGLFMEPTDDVNIFSVAVDVIF
jgi:Gram-negative porin